LGVDDRPGKRIRASTHNMEREIKTIVRSRRVSRETVGRKGSIRNAIGRLLFLGSIFQTKLSRKFQRDR
jgi:hypothetical protein